MFQTIRYRLLLSYLGVLTIVLSVFAIAVRITFASSLKQQLTEKLTALGQGAAANIEFDHDRLQPDSDFSVEDLTTREQALQWFDLQGNILGQQGQYVLTLPLLPHQSVQVQAEQVEGVTLPLFNADTGQLIGYIRASESLKDLNDTLQRLDWGLGGGVLAALLISGLGGIWLTHQAMQPIEQSFQRLQQFTADASHELRSPLMVVKSNVAVALKYSEGMRELDAEKFQAIASATNQMTQLTEDLLLLARTAQKSQPHDDAIDLTAILRHLVLLHTPQAEAKHIALKLQPAPTLYVSGDGVQLARLFTSLIENALHYTLEQGKVEIQMMPGEAQVVVHVQDTGVGIAPEHLDSVFARFWRADQSRSYWSGGSGLGLAIAQDIARKHNGAIAVASQVGVGSCFTVRLPAKPPPAD